MSLPVRSVPHSFQPDHSPLFSGRNVHLVEARWSPVFAQQVTAWVSSATQLLVMENGEALVLGIGGRAPVRPRPLELCAAFRFENLAIEPALAGPALHSNGDAQLVQLAPAALLRFYWRRHALALGYPAPSEHVEEDAVALLRHAVSLARSEARALSECVTPGRMRQRMLAQNAKTVMAQAIADPHPIAHVARELDTSPFHLAHVFRTEVGNSPHQYLVRLRVTAALIQLRNGARDLSTLALDLGFCHHSHFTAVFRRVLGYTPREVRRMLTAECIADLGIAARRCS